MNTEILSYIKIHWRSIVLVFLCSAIVVVYVLGFGDHRDYLKIAFLDIGQGDAIYIESPKHNKILIDGGPDDTLVSRLQEQTHFFDRAIDVVLVTNPDKDHFGGFIPLIQKYPVGAFVDPGVEANDNPLYQELLWLVEQKHITRVTAQAGQRIDIGGGAYIDILFPDRSVPSVAHNDGSIVAKLVYGKTSVLLTGDAPQNVEEYLVSKYGPLLESDILKVGHHGSRTSTGDAFVKTVNPTWAVISAGKGNSYGHPHKETIDTLASHNVETLVTIDEGTIVFESDGLHWTRK